jgi:pimeloyl-ACP methyl ester carboxylesterase
MPEQTSHRRPHDSTLRSTTLDRLALFQHSFPRTSVNAAGAVWTFRRTCGQASQARTIVMLPGIQGGGDVFFDAVLRLGAALPIVTVDAPDLDDVGTMTAATAAFLDALHLNRVHILGASLGGYLAQAFALAYPGRVDQLLIANGFYDPRPFLAKQPPAATVAAMDADSLVRKNLAALIEAPADDPGVACLQAVMAALVGPVQSMTNYKSRLMLLMGAKRLERPQIPDSRVMIVDDDQDPMVPAEMRNALRSRYAKAEHHAVSGGGHMPAIQRPAEFAELVGRRLGASYVYQTSELGGFHAAS